MPATIKCREEIQDQIIEQVIDELVEALEPLDLDLDWENDESLEDVVSESVVATDKGIKVKFPVGDVYCDDVYEYTDSIVQIFKNLKSEYPDIAIQRGSVYVEDKYDEDYKHGYKFSCTEKDSDLNVKSYM